MIHGFPGSIQHSALTKGTERLAQYMDLLSTRQKLVTSNLANADTPGYHTKDIDFQFEFMSFVNGQEAQVEEPQGFYEKPDGNNVSVDREARLLAENTIRFNLASTLARGSIAAVQKAIHEGRS